MQPLTHHEIMSLVAPFARSGRHVDLAASDRPQRRLAFKLVEHAAVVDGLPADATIVFHCHRGGRSQAVAERYRRKGYTNLHNLAGGIDAWAREIDREIPTY